MDVLDIVNNNNSALVICILAVGYLVSDKKKREKIQYEDMKRREDRQDKINNLLQEEIKDGIKKSHEQHNQILQRIEDNRTMIIDKAKRLNDKINIVLKLGKDEGEDY